MSWLKKIRTYLPQQIPGPMAVLYEKVATGGLCGFYRQVASEVTSTLTSGRVLDVGTGPGHLLIEIARLNRDLELVGVDLSWKMLKIADSLIRQEINTPVRGNGAEHTATSNISDTSGIRLVRGDVQNLLFPDGTFGLVVSTLSFHHWHNPIRGIQECLRVTAPGGQCWIYDLRTDVSARTHAESVTGRRLDRWALGWIFKFHGVDPKDYQAQSVAEFLDADTTVEAEVQPTYLKLKMEKPLEELQGRGTHCRNELMGSVAAPA
jgi:ubiquinone/menaquinone biosynthesis C-methylase UbiE